MKRWLKDNWRLVVCYLCATSALHVQSGAASFSLLFDANWQSWASLGLIIVGLIIFDSRK